MIKLIVFIVLFVVIISAFTLNLGFVVQGFSNIKGFFDNIPEIFKLLIDSIETIFNAPLITTILLTGIAFVVIKYVLSLLGDEKK